MARISLNALEAAINAYLRLDANTTCALAQHQALTVKIDITDWDCHFFFKPSSYGINLYEHWHTPADTVISGTFASLIHNTKETADRTASTDTITISGNAQLVEPIRQIFRNIDINWQQQLSKFTGHNLAEKIIDTTRSLSEFFNHRQQRLKQQISDYALYEGQLSPTAAQITAFTEDVQTLKQRLNSLSDQINQHSQAHE